ncbi:leucyl aminopeptidase family protein [Agarilytica rhodophyticola]|uniref:leucyl aminopeptidase family protein n=1 Tax=Agarilytica rhodophyticola TaxID=1737490 RepID=UPI000B345CBD|nr:leucyl aminopeptidase family protein [Agarilytica rhodophyticola]
MFNLVYGREGRPIRVIKDDNYEQWLAEQSVFIRNWLVHSGFEGKGYCLIPKQDGHLDQVVVVVTDDHSVWQLSDLAKALPEASYYLEGSSEQLAAAALGWILGQYQFTEYKDGVKHATLCVNDETVVNNVTALAKGVVLTRDLVNTPAGDMMPEHLSLTMQTLGREYGAQFSEIVGDELLKENFPTIHMVGRASEHAPRLLELNWGEESAPKLCLVGKGVCFDSGGLDLKPPAGMRLMKKDMGGAAHVLGLAAMIMAKSLPVRLRVLIPAVENAVSGNAFRPGDIVTTRKGLTVEIDNTDAEGRLVLCDALALADDGQPDLIVDFATLTGAARVALGLELPGFYSTDDAFAAELMTAGESEEDNVWRLPLHQPYASYMKGSISDLVNSSPTPMGGSITAALYLQKFVEHSPWVHFDVGAWNDRVRPGRPKGGEAMGLRAVFKALEKRYAS